MQIQTIENKIYEIREQKVMLDFDLATMYEVETRTLKQAVKRNEERFPSDFMFQLSKTEWNELITNCDKLGKTIKHNPGTPSAFTEQGIAMLSSVLRSKKAILVNITIMRAFVYMRQYALTHKELTVKLQELEIKYDQKFLDFEQAIQYLLHKDTVETAQKERKRIGFGN